jgi:hypothetical protein
MTDTAPGDAVVLHRADAAFIADVLDLAAHVLPNNDPIQLRRTIAHLLRTAAGMLPPDVGSPWTTAARKDEESPLI